MKSLIIIWIVAGVAVVGSIVYMNRTINSMVGEIQSDTLYVRQESDLQVSNGQPTLSITEPSDLQPALGYKVLNNTVNPEMVSQTNLKVAQ